MLDSTRRSLFGGSSHSDRWQVRFSLMPDTDAQPDQNVLHPSIQRLGFMIQGRRLTKKFFETEEFLTTLEDVEACLYSTYESDVWNALSIAGRASSISKPAESTFLPMIKRRLSKTLPTWCELDDGEDRYYLAKALRSAPNQQIIDLAFIELAREEAGEKARRVWADIAFEHSSSREEFLGRLNECVAQVKRRQSLTTDSLIRRLRRISNVIAEDLATAEKPTGSDFGNTLRNFYGGRTIVNGPDDRELREESAAEFAQSLSRIVRLNFRAASDPAVYGVLLALRQWWHPSSPPASFETLSKKVAHAGIDALHLFARQGVRNKRLREAIVQSCGRHVVEQLSNAVADADVSLPEDISYWFVHGSEQVGQKTTAAIEALSDRRLDEYVGRLLIAISSPDSNYQTIDVVANRLNILMPEEGNTLSRAASRLAQITQWSKAIVRSRNIELFGKLDDVVAYDPTTHSAIDDCVIGSQVLIATPGVVRKIPGRPQILITKAEVRNR